MKKLLLLSTLITILPFTANAGTITGPAPDETEHPVIADAESPYQTAQILPGDTTNIVTASYVKEAYNDTIAAINRVNNDKQRKLYNLNGEEMNHEVFDGSIFVENLDSMSNDSGADRFFVTATATAAGIKSQRVTAVDVWGSTHTVDLGLKTVTQ